MPCYDSTAWLREDFVPMPYCSRCLSLSQLLMHQECFPLRSFLLSLNAGQLLRQLLETSGKSAGNKTQPGRSWTGGDGKGYRDGDSQVLYSGRVWVELFAEHSKPF